MPIPNQKPTAKIIYASIACLVTWFGLILQFQVRTGSVSNFFSFFTILCNLLVALHLSITILAPMSRIGRFMSGLPAITAVTLYIFIVGLVYNTVLRGLVPLSGWYLVADTLVHVVVPVLSIVYWIAFRPAGMLKWRDGFYWAVFPFAYLIYSLIRGSMVHWYPYPFLNAGTLGYTKVLLNAAVVTLAFMIAGMLLIAINNRRHVKA